MDVYPGKFLRSLVLLGRVFAASLLTLIGFAGHAQASIAFVQQNSATPQTPQTTVTVPFALAQTGGNLNIVVVGWNDSTTAVSSVNDTSGNIYLLAVGPTVQSGTATQSIYYAKSISPAAAGANAVTVTFTGAANAPDIRIAEYSGLDSVNPFDVAIASQGTSATSNSGTVATTNANDLLIGANMVQTLTTAAGTGFTSRVITTPDGDILEDRVVTAVGSYSATATLTSGKWIMQMVAFRAASAATAPTITGLNPTSGPVGTVITITGNNFGATQGTSSVAFNGTAASPTGWGATSISVPVPSGATSGNVVVTVGGIASNGAAFTVGSASSIAFVQMNSATPQAAQTPVTVAYTQAQTAGNLNVVVVGWNDATATITSVTDSSGNTYSIAATALVQAGTASQAIYYAKNIAAAGAGANTVTVNFSGAAFHPDVRIAEYSGLDTTNPLDTSAGAQGNTATSDSGPASTSNPNDLLVGANTVQGTTTAAGTGYTSRGITADGDILEDRVVNATGNYNATAVLNQTQLWIMQVAAFRAATGGGGSSNPTISSLSPTSGPVGTSVTISGTNFGQTQGASSVTFNGTPASVTSWSATSIVATAPTTNSGNVVVTVGGVPSNSALFTVTPQSPVISSLSPTSGPVGQSVTISGTNFGGSQGASSVTFNGIAATPSSWSATSIIAPVPAGATSGNVVVTVGGAASNGVAFSVQSTVAGIKLVQHIGKDAGSTTSSTLAFPANNTAGNWIGVVIRAGRSSQVFTVSDTRANTYRQAIQFNVTADTPNGDTLAIFYAENIAGGANTVTVSDSINGSTLRFAILEYSGIVTSGSFDVAVANQGTGTAPNSGPATTTSGGDLLLAAIMTANSQTFTAAAGFAIEDRVPSSGTKLVSEDQVQVAAGTASATATLSGSDVWGAALAAFKASIGGVTPPSITNVTPTSGVVGASVTINGSNFGATQGSSTVKFNGTTGTPSSWSSTSIVVPVPAGATSGNIVVTVNGLSSNAVAFTVTPPPPSIASLTPSSGPIGTSVAIAGANFGATQGTSTVTFNGIATTPTGWSANSITAPVPNGATTGNVVVTVGGVSSSGVAFTVTSTGPSLTTLSLTQGPVGASVTITGLNFGASQGTSAITFNGTLTTAINWSDTAIDTTVPAGATSGNVIVTVNGVASNGLPFTVTPPPNITNINPNAGPIGTVVNVTGTNFGPTVGTRASNLLFNGIAARTTSWSNTLIVAPAPAAATSGNVVVAVGGINSNGVPYTVTPGPNISSVNPTAGVIGTSVTINGAGFGASQGTSTITFNGIAATPTSWSDTAVVTPVPSGATTGNVVVTAGGIASNGVSFTVNPGSPVKLIQHTSTDAGTTTSASLAFASNNTAGNFIAVVIRAGKSGQVFTVSDTRGNTYRKALTFNMTVDANTMGIYYAENISSGANTVTVSDTVASSTLRFAIMEYSGIATANSLDATAVAQGTNVSPNSGNATPSLGGDLLLGEIVTADPAAFTAGAGYKIEDFVPAEPNTKLITEDQLQTVIGPASATATLGASDPWGAAVVAFKSASGAPPPPISVSVSPTSASVGAGSGSQNFTATVQNDFRNGGVTWSLSGAGCSGNTCGALSNVSPTTVTYSGPTSIPNPATVTLTATSVTDATKNGTATITVIQGTLSVFVSPKRAAVTMSALQTVQFTSTVNNDPSNSGVVWSVDGNNGGSAASGTVSATGLYTPGSQPGVHIVTATSAANASVSASSSVAVTDLPGVYTYHNDVQRTGQNLQEYALTPANVASSSFTRLFSCPADGYVYAQPLWVANRTVGGVNRNILFIATEHDSVYAYDADSPSCTLLWKVSFLGNGVTTMPYTDIAPNPTDDVFPEIGITSTPVIDPATNTIYVEAKTKETVGTGCSSGSPCYVHRLHALDIITGAEKFGGPKVISANGFVSLRHFNRPALLLANGVVYVTFGSHGDNCNWQGWIFGFNASTLAQTFVWNTTSPNGCGGGAIWQGGAGPAADASGNIYFATGNGTYDGNNNFSDTAIKMSATGTLLDWFTPFNESTFQANDIDLASAGIVILPDSVASAAHPHLAIATGKVAILYLLDISQASAGQTKMGKFHSGSNLDVQEVIPVPPPNTTQLDGGIYGVPAYWNGNIYTTGQNFPLSQFTIANGLMATPQFAKSTNLFPPRGSTPGVSSSGTTNGVVWILDLAAWPSSGNAILDAYDATNVSNLLFSSPSGGAAAAGPAVKFTVPTVANGKVYVGGQSTVTVYGLLPN